MPTLTELEAAGRLIAEYLEKQGGDTDGIGLVPGYRLVPVRDRQALAARSIPLATAARMRRNGQRKAKIAEIIRDQTTAYPAITNEQLAIVLNGLGLCTYKGKAWTARSVALFKRTEIEPPAT